MFSTGERGPAIALLGIFRPMISRFKSSRTATSTSAAAAARQAAEDAAEASRWATR